MTWDQVESALRTYIETQWANSAYSSFELVWENEPEPDVSRYMSVYIEGTYAEKSGYGGVGKHATRVSDRERANSDSVVGRVTIIETKLKDAAN